MRLPGNAKTRMRQHHNESAFRLEPAFNIFEYRNQMFNILHCQKAGDGIERPPLQRFGIPRVEVMK